MSYLMHYTLEECPAANGPVDYALFVNGRLLGILEVKRGSVNPQNVLGQAKRYASGCPAKIPTTPRNYWTSTR